MPKVSKRGQRRQSSKPEVKYLRTYIYVRLSEKDGGHGRRDSIYIQKQICEDYAKKHPEMLVVKVYADNGVTGTTFQRDAFEELMDDVANKKVTRKIPISVLFLKISGICFMEKDSPPGTFGNTKIR